MVMDSHKADLSALRIDRASREDPESPGRWKVYVSVLSGVVLLALAVFLGPSVFSGAPEVSLVTASFVSPSQTGAVLTASGYVVAQRKAAVASKGTGRLVFLGVVEGDRVKRDQVIARLEDNDIRAQLAQADANVRLSEAELVDARQTLRRTRTLFEKGLASQAELDAAQARHDRVLASIDVARATVDAAQVALENTLIRAPFDGTVLTKNADVGEIVAPLAASASSRAAVVTIADMRSLEVEADVSESNIQRISPGQPAEITLVAYPGIRYRGNVTKIVPTADRAKATVLVKVGFERYDDSVLPEMSAKVLFLDQPLSMAQTEDKPVLAVPASAVVERDGQRVVYRVADQRAVEVRIGSGRTIGRYIEVLYGLASGDKVVDGPTDAIQDGTSLTLQ